MEKELYIVTVYKKEDLQSLYDDLEKEGGGECIPERKVECSLKRPTSRNTHYYLTEEEAQELKKDPRVWDVQLPPEKLGLILEKHAFAVTQTGDFDKSNQPNSDSVQWGLYRNFQETHDATWASDATQVKTETIEYNLSGRNVDIVIVDDTITVDHPDFTVNPDGTGDSRVQQLDWFTYNSAVTALGDLDGQTLPTGSYLYLAGEEDDHGTPVTSCAAGSRHGMAKSANIYNIEFRQPKRAIIQGSTSGSTLTVTYVYPGSAPLAVGQRVKGPGIIGTRTISSFGTGTGGVGTYNLSSSVSTNQTDQQFTTHYSGTWDLLLWDYIRAFHRNKPVNPGTGKRNPTICNCSFGFVVYPSLANISSVTYRGTTYNSSNYSPWTLDELYSAFGVVKSGSTAFSPANYTAYEADIQDAIDDGIFFVTSAGNSNCKIANSTDADYDNTLSYFGTNYYYHRGGAFSSNENVIVAGSCTSLALNYKSSFSDCGPRVDIFAAGERVACAASSTKEIGEIIEWEVTSNVVTFKIVEPTGDDWLSNMIGKEVEIGMATTVALNGVHVIQSYSYEPLKFNATLFTINLPYPDTPQTSEAGYVIGQYTSRGAYPMDIRGAYAFLQTIDGTSFSSPNVAGMLACLLEIYPRMDYWTAYGLLADKGAYNNMFDLVTSDYSDERSLRGAINLILGYQSDPLYYQFPEERPASGLVYPKNNYKSRFDVFYRPAGGDNAHVYPRVSNLR